MNATCFTVASGMSRYVQLSSPSLCYYSHFVDKLGPPLEACFAPCGYLLRRVVPCCARFGGVEGRFVKICDI